jgi:hypothetical protein
MWVYKLIIIKDINKLAHLSSALAQSHCGADKFPILHRACPFEHLSKCYRPAEGNYPISMIEVDQNSQYTRQPVCQLADHRRMDGGTLGKKNNFSP